MTPPATNDRGSFDRKSGDDRRRPRPPEHLRREAARLLEAMPPQAVEAEICLLGSLILEYKTLGDVVGILKGPDDFSRPDHGTIYRVMVELYDRDNAFDLLKLHQTLTDRSLLEAVGGIDYLVRIAESVPAATFAGEYAKLIREKAVLRELIHAAGDILVRAHTSGDQPRELLQEAEQMIFRIAQQSEQTSADSLSALLDEALAQLEAADGRHTTGLPTSYPELDELTSGLQPGELMVLAARPSMGKTALAINLAENVAMAGHPVAVFSLEMSKQQLVQRLICSRADVDSQKLRRGAIHDDEYRRVLQACNELSQAPIFIDDTPSLSLLQLRAKARRMRERFGIEFVIIDYLQLMTAGGRVENRQVEVSEISRGVKAMARELHVPVLCLSQLNRAAEQREGHRPRMSDLRESGSIEQDADVVAMLHREAYYHTGDETWLSLNAERSNLAELIIAKQRNGPTGTVNLMWDSRLTKFHPWSSMSDPGRSGRGSSIQAFGSDPAAQRSAFQQGRSSAPASGFRDGGGPEGG